MALPKEMPISLNQEKILEKSKTSTASGNSAASSDPVTTIEQSPQPLFQEERDDMKLQYAQVVTEDKLDYEDTVPDHWKPVQCTLKEAEQALLQRVAQQKHSLAGMSVKTPAIKDINNQKYIVIPKHHVDDSETLFLIIRMLALRLGYQLYFDTQSKPSNIKIPLESQTGKFLIGVTFNLTDNKFKRLGRSKSPYELGQKAAHALRLQGAATKLNMAKLLKRNNTYFNNVPLKGKNDPNRPFLLQGILFAGIDDKDIAHRYEVVLSTLLRELGLAGYSNKDINKSFDSQIIRFKDYVTRYNRVVSSSSKKKKRRGAEHTITLRPTRPKDSSLLTKEQNAFMQDVLGTLFPTVRSFEQHWMDWILDGSLIARLKYLSKIYQTRHELRAKFASFTTKRLNRIRNTNPTFERLSKASVTTVHVSELHEKSDGHKTFVRDFVNAFGETYAKTYADRRFRSYVDLYATLVEYYQREYTPRELKQNQEEDEKAVNYKKRVGWQHKETSVIIWSELNTDYYLLASLLRKLRNKRRLQQNYKDDLDQLCNIVNRLRTNLHAMKKVGNSQINALILDEKTSNNAWNIQGDLTSTLALLSGVRSKLSNLFGDEPTADILDTKFSGLERMYLEELRRALKT
jgi:hypothetical protein